MSGSDASVYLSAVRWGDEGLSFQDFLRRFPQPQVARVIRGQHGHVGVPSLASPGLNSIVFLARGGPKLRVTAQCVKFKENRRVVTVGPRLAISENYRGWFEILSEDGRASRCYESVAELLRRLPDTCLVREPVKAHLAHPEKPDTVTDKTRTLPQGETLVLVREVRASLGRLRPTPGRFLRCLTSSGDTVYLAAELRGKFSPIAKEGNISGVHTMKTLLCKRFPLMVRLVHTKQNVGLKTAEMRLLSAEKEECIMALPLMKDAPPVMLPPTATLKLQVPKNGDVLTNLPEYLRISERSNELMEQATDTIDVVDGHKEPQRVPPHRSMSEPSTKTRPETIERELSAPDDDRYEEIDQIYDYVRGFAPLPEKIKVELQQQHVNGVEASKTSSGSLHPEQTKGDAKPLPPPIETIPPRRFSLATDPGVSPTSPPPVILKAARVKDTDSHIYEAVIRRAEDRSKLGRAPAKAALKPPNNKLFVKSSHPVRNGKPRLLRQARPPVLLKDATPVPVVPLPQKTVRSKACRTAKSTVTTSPLFNIRYKSMTNLAVDFNDTLDSSNSGGGRTSSGESAGSKASRERSVPRKLSRPKSLSNLFWDVEANNKYNLMHSELKTNQCIYVADGPPKMIARAPGGKRVGTLYL